MRPIPAAQCSSVVSLLNEGYSHCQIKEITCLPKGMVGNISKELEEDKENHLWGQPSKLSACDKKSIVCQITTGKLDNAVQATHFIKSIIPNPVNPQTVRNGLKEDGLCLAMKKKVLMLKAAHHVHCLKFAEYHKNWTVEDWKRGLWSDETKIN